MKEVIDGEVVTTIKPQSTTAAASEDTYKRKEQQVKITVGYEAPLEEGTKGERLAGTFDEETYNKYLLDDKGPRKVIDYSKAAVDEDDLSSFEKDFGGVTTQ